MFLLGIVHPKTGANVFFKVTPLEEIKDIWEAGNGANYCFISEKIGVTETKEKDFLFVEVEEFLKELKK